jgi:hypothetical protein
MQTAHHDLIINASRFVNCDVFATIVDEVKATNKGILFNLLCLFTYQIIIYVNYFTCVHF